MQISMPLGPMRSATRRAWPPAPNVQSTAISPGCGSRMSISSPARTGTWVRVMSRRMAKALCDLVDLGEQVARIRGVAAAVPDLEMVHRADHHDVFRDRSVLEQRRVERDAAG